MYNLQKVNVVHRTQDIYDFVIWCICANLVSAGPVTIYIFHGLNIIMIIIGAVYISQLLNVTPTLQHLYMYNNDIGDEGMAKISEALQHNKSLITLWVPECGLSVKGTVASVWIKM